MFYCGHLTTTPLVHVWVHDHYPISFEVLSYISQSISIDNPHVYKNIFRRNPGRNHSEYVADMRVWMQHHNIILISNVTLSRDLIYIIQKITPEMDILTCWINMKYSII